jgi:hypothetical protein
MAKGQKRSNKEIKKPKQVKPKTATSSTPSARLSDAQQAGKISKK